MPEILDNWTVAQAWQHVYGDRPRPEASDVPDDMLCETDGVIASYMGDETTEGRRKAAAALLYLWPRLVSCPLCPGPSENRQRYVATAVVECVSEYRGEYENVSTQDECRITLALAEWNLASITPHCWGIIWDAMGTSGVNTRNKLLWDFYKHAEKVVFFSELE